MADSNPAPSIQQFVSAICRGQKRVKKMIERKMTLAELILIAGTRVALGAGIGLLLSSRLNDDQRRAAGLALALIGGLTTIPLVMGIVSKKSDDLQAAA